MTFPTKPELVDTPGQGVIIWTGALPDHDKADGTLKRIRIVRVGLDIRHEQLDGFDSMGVERWNALESRFSWKLIDALAVHIEAANGTA